MGVGRETKAAPLPQPEIALRQKRSIKEIAGVLEQNRTKPADEAMDNSVSNIQLTPEAKRIIEGEIAYQTSGRGFWISVVFGYVFLGVFAVGFSVMTISDVWNGGDTQWLALLEGLWLLIPGWGISGINRSIKNRKGAAPQEKAP